MRCSPGMSGSSAAAPAPLAFLSRRHHVAAGSALFRRKRLSWRPLPLVVTALGGERCSSTCREVHATILGVRCLVVSGIEGNLLTVAYRIHLA